MKEESQKVPEATDRRKPPTQKPDGNNQNLTAGAALDRREGLH